MVIFASAPAVAAASSFPGTAATLPSFNGFARFVA